MGVTLGVSRTLATAETQYYPSRLLFNDHCGNMPQLTTSMHKQTRIEYIIIRLLLALLLSTGCDIYVYDVTTCYCIHPMHDKGALRFYDYCCRSSKDTIFLVYSNAGCLLSHCVASHLYLVMSILHRTWALKSSVPSHCATQGRFHSRPALSQKLCTTGCIFYSINECFWSACFLKATGKLIFTHLNFWLFSCWFLICFAQIQQRGWQSDFLGWPKTGTWWPKAYPIQKQKRRCLHHYYWDCNVVTLTAMLLAKYIQWSISNVSPVWVW